MDSRIALGSLLLLAATATAQVQSPIPGQTPLVPGQPATGATPDPDRPQQTPAEQLEELAKQKARLEQEILYVRDRAAHAKEELNAKLTRHKQDYRAIDAGVAATVLPKPTPAPRRFAQIAGDAERDAFAQDVLALVNHRPITQARFDQVKNYLKDLPSSGDDSMQSQRALFELIRIEAVASTFEESEGEAQLGEALSQLQQGKPMADVAKAFGILTGGQPDGSIEVTRNSSFGSLVELTAFNTPAGQQSRPFRNAQGYVILRTDHIEKGNSPELDKVIGSAVQIPYTADQAMLQKAQFAVNAGQVDIVVRDQHVLDMLPQMFRPPANMPIPEGDAAVTDEAIALMTRKMQQLQAEIDRLSKSDEAGAAARIKDLEQQYRTTKQSLQDARSAKDHADGKSDKTDQLVPVKQAPAPTKKD
ncbi:MAG TPA: hypothetical protein VFZ65_00695 [Planctomycetota bacterium]|nr:hypothetical protein [Planctomycetota bacterium]